MRRFYNIFVVDVDDVDVVDVADVVCDDGFFYTLKGPVQCAPNKGPLILLYCFLHIMLISKILGTLEM